AAQPAAPSFPKVVEVNTFEENLRYLSGLLDQRAVPVKHREQLNSLLASFLREEKETKFPSIKYWVPLMAVFETARKDLHDKNPELHRICTRALNVEISSSIKRFIDQIFLPFSPDEAAKVEKVPEVLSPPALFSLAC